MTEVHIIIEVCLVRTININTWSPGHKLYRLHVGSGLIIHCIGPASENGNIMLADVTARANCPTINYVWLEANIIYTRVQQVAVCQNISSVLQNIPSLAKI